METEKRKYPSLEARSPVSLQGFDAIKWPLCPSTWGVGYFDKAKDPGLVLVRYDPCEKTDKPRPTVVHTPIVAPVSTDLFSELLAFSRPSAMGKNTETVHDPSLRRSHEIPLSEDIGYPHLIVHEWQVAPIIARLLSNMGFCCTMHVCGHKIVLYEEGDFFVEHVDSDHGEEDLIATAVVEIEVDGVPFHNCLEISEDGETWKPAFTNAAPLSVCVMGRGVKHRVQPAKGRRLVVTYDITRKTGWCTTDVKPNPVVLESISKCVREGLDVLRSAGVKKFAVLCSFSYHTKNVPLNGIDEALFDVLAKEGVNPEAIHVAQDAAGNFIHGDVYDHQASSDAYSTLMKSHGFDEELIDDEGDEGDKDEEDDEEESADRGQENEERKGEVDDKKVDADVAAAGTGEYDKETAEAPPDQKEDQSASKRRRRAFFSWTPSMTDEPHPVFSERVCMGDVCLIRHPFSRPYDRIEPKKEVFLGNEGFSSEEEFTLYRAIQCTLP